MSEDVDYDPDFLDREETVPRPQSPKVEKPRALVVEEDIALTRICTQRLARLGMDAHVVWTREEAVAFLSRADVPVAFVYVDARLMAGACGDALSEIRTLRPSTPFVVASRSIADVLHGDGVVVARPFDQDQFQAAFDASLFEEERRRVLLDAAAAVRVTEAADAAALDALPETARAALQLSA